MQKSIKVAIFGSNGRMGQTLLNCGLRDQKISIQAALVKPDSELINQDIAALLGGPAAGIKFSADINAIKTCDVLIDFSSPAASLANLEFCSQNNIATVIGTTGFNAAELQQLKSYADRTKIVFAANMSVGVNLTYKLMQIAAKVLGNADAEIIEAHHKHKKDAPSGTALQMGQAIAAARQQDFNAVAVYDGHKQNERKPGSIGFACMRAGEIIGEHTAVFATESERVEISHKAASRDIFANGALLAAKWLVQQPAGLYDMEDVLQLDEVLREVIKK